MASKTGISEEELKRAYADDSYGAAYTGKLAAFLDSLTTPPAPTMPGPAPISRPMGWEPIDADKIPREPPPAATPPPKAAPAVGGLNREEQHESRDKLPGLILECFEGMDKGLMFALPIFKADMSKLEPEIWATVSYAQCSRLSDILIEIGIVNPYMAQLIRLANQTDDARFVLKIFGPRSLATATYAQSSIKQQRAIRTLQEQQRKGQNR